MANVKLLPPNLAALADVTGDGGVKYGGIAAVKVELGEEKYTVSATDTYRAVIVQGEYTDSADEFPDVPGLESAPNGKTGALVPAGPFKEVLARAAKNKRLPRKALGRVAVVCGENVVTLGTTDLQRYDAVTVRQQEGHFPPLEKVMPKDEPKAKVTVNAKMLRELLKTLEALGEERGARVEIGIYAEDKPVRLRTENSYERQEVTALIMPLA